jgi:hypothetical protein
MAQPRRVVICLLLAGLLSGCDTERFPLPGMHTIRLDPPVQPTVVQPTMVVLATPDTVGRAGNECQQRVAEHDAQLDALEADLLRRREAVEQLDAQLRLRKADVDMFEEAHPRGVPEEVYRSYTNAVDDHNSVLRERRERALDYNAGIDRFNALQDQRNSLARTC